MCFAAIGCGAGSLPTPQNSQGETVPIATFASSTQTGFDLAGTITRGAGIGLDDARIALLDRKGGRVIIIDTSGRVTGPFGKSGYGDGEFRYAQLLVRADSGMAVFDGLRTVFVRFDARGRIRKDLPQFDAVGIPEWGAFTGMAQLSDGSWVYSVSGLPDAGRTQQALYHRSAGTTRLIAATPAGPSRLLRFDCGARLSGQSPVFWPTLRWAAVANKVVYAATDADRVVIWDADTRDSIVITGEASPRRPNEEAGLAVTDSVGIQTLSQRCTMTKEDVLRQRGMAERMPVIRSVGLSPDGTVWVALTTLPDEPSFIRIHRQTATDTLVGSAFPDLFLTPTRFLTEATDTTGHTTLTVWEVRAPTTAAGTP